MKRGPALVLLLALPILGACGRLLEPAAAVVDGEKITVSEVETALEEYKATKQFECQTQQRDPVAFQRQYEQEFLTLEIARRVMEPAAEELGIEVTDEKVQERIEIVQREEPNFEERLKESCLTLEEFEELTELRILEDELREEVTKGLNPTEEELRAFYEENAQNFVQMRASIIAVDQQGKAQQLFKQLKKAKDVPSTFAQLARANSTDDRSAAQGGDVGILTSDTPPQVLQAASRLKINEVSAPIQSDIGWLLLMVTERDQLPFEAVRSGIVEQLAGQDKQREWQEWLDQAYEDADIDINPRYGALDPQSKRVVDPQPDELPGTEDIEVPDPAPPPGG